VDETEDRQGAGANGHRVATQAGPVILGASEDPGPRSVESFLEDRMAEHWYAWKGTVGVDATLVRSFARAERRTESCTQQSVTLPPAAGAKYRQELLFGSDRWHLIYGTIRSANEGMNG
jgi:hypothetical protein